LPTAGGVLGVGTVVVIAPSLSVNGPRGRTNRRRCYQRSSSPDALASAELAPSPGEHRSRREGCRASQGRFPPPLWIRRYAVGRYGGHRSSWRLAPPTAFARSRVRAFARSGCAALASVGLCVSPFGAVLRSQLATRERAHP